MKWKKKRGSRECDHSTWSHSLEPLFFFHFIIPSHSHIANNLFLLDCGLFLLDIMAYMTYHYINQRQKEYVMKTLNEFFNQQMQDPEFRSEYEKIQPEMDIIRAIVDARLSQNLTQKELAERTGINQADISKLENGTRNPSLKLLQRLADGMDMILKIEFIPKPKHK